MNKINYSRIIALLAFIALAGFSCFWTAESLFIWQPSITIYGAWMLAIVFYIVASICFGKILKAFDKNEDFYGKIGGRLGSLVIGFLGLTLFWGISFATNTHTLLYRASIENVITDDLNRTQSYLTDLKDNNVEIKKIEQKYQAKSDQVSAHIARLIAECEDPSNPGIGIRYNTILAELELVLGQPLQRVKTIGKTRAQLLITTEHYHRQAREILKVEKAKCNAEIRKVKATMNSKALANLMTNNDIALSDINRMEGINHDIIAAAVNDLDNSYSFIKSQSKYLEFKDNDREKYTKEESIPEAKKMLAINKVWRDFLTTDKFDDHGFIWWIAVALMVDLAAFIFFNKI